MLNICSGKFIVFEGLDGSGQTTQASLLRDFFVKKGKKVILTKEPTQNSKAGIKIKKILTEKIKVDPLELQKLFSKDREKHLKEVIIPALEKDKIVISDRYFFSSFAYGAAEGLKLQELIDLNKDFLYPDLIFFLKVEPATCIKRIEKRKSLKTIFEAKEKLTRVFKFYKVFPKTFKNIIIINGEKSIKEVFKEIKRKAFFLTKEKSHFQDLKSIYF